MSKLHELFGIRERRYEADGSRWPELIGVELELEGVKNARQIPFWATHADGSLRDGIEFVLEQPAAGLGLTFALDEFFGARLQCANTSRTSTHIHINMTDATLDTLRCMTMLMYMIEEPVFNIVGETRKWAGYAMPLSDMEPARIRQILAGSDLAQVVQHIAPPRNQERYYGFNTASIRKHGTVEFRYYPGGPSRVELENWIDLAVQIKAAGKAMTPAQLTERLSDPRSVVDFLAEYLSDYWMNNILQQVNAEYLFSKFNEVATLAYEQELLERRENLVFLTEPFLKFVKSNLLAEAGRQYIDGIKEAFEVLSVGDWWYHFREAEERDFEAGGGEPTQRHAPTKAPKIKPVVWDEIAGARAVLEYGDLTARRPPPAAPRPARVAGDMPIWAVNPFRLDDPVDDIPPHDEED